MRAVVTPGRSEPREAMASDRARRIRSWAGLPTTVWSKSRSRISILPPELATGPMLLTWASPQIHTAGPSGRLRGASESSHS